MYLSCNISGQRISHWKPVTVPAGHGSPSHLSLAHLNNLDQTAGLIEQLHQALVDEKEKHVQFLQDQLAKAVE